MSTPLFKNAMLFSLKHPVLATYEETKSLFYYCWTYCVAEFYTGVNKLRPTDSGG